MKMIDLFAGFGGFSLAGYWIGWQTLMFCENANYPKKVLKKNFPGIFIHDDIKDLTKQIIEKEFIKKYGYYDPEEIILTAGVPCQPASQAGKRKGTKDNRWLWNPTLRIVREVKPSYAVFENVPGILSLENGRPFEDILNALESYGYQVESFVIPACSVGAWHRRDRIWIIAYSKGNTCNFRYDEKQTTQTLQEKRSNRKDVSNSNNQGSQRWNSGKLQKCSNKQFIRQGSSQYNGSIWQSEPELGRVAHGISNRVERLKGLGNAVVPQLVFEIFKVIDYDNQNQEH